MSGELITVTLPDGTQKNFPRGVTPFDIAKSIGEGLARVALAARIEDQLWDLNRPLEKDCTIALITKDQEEGLEIIRHDAAHVMAEAVKELYPETQVTIGPAIQDGFYYDFHRETSFTPEDLERIEARMHEIVGRDELITREVWNRNEAIKFFRDQGEEFKAEIIEDLPESEDITLYRQGDFIDLCRGPHLPSTGRLGASFKLMKLAGAHWRGDAKNPMLQRIYGTAWATDKELRSYLHRLEEAEKRDHRKLGREMGLFHQQEEAVGNVFWHEKGWTLYRIVENYVRSRLEEENYQEVKTPQMLDRSLWEASGHWDKFRDAMFTVESDEGKTLAVKPMNCPCHVQIFRQGLKSYRDLPLRMAEFGSCHRNEPSGALHGLFRVRAFVQDDAHIFCTEDQIISETKEFCRLLISVYEDFGFSKDQITIKFSDRPEVRAGDDSVWDKAENALSEAAQATGLEYQLNPGEGAFYGPKLEFVLRDAIGRDWQCGTLQADFVLPERLNANFIGEDGNKHRPVMLHRAILGSLERFIAVLIENYSGRLPLWLAPTQVAVATITSDADPYAHQVVDTLKKAGIRAITDLRNEKISYKIRELSLSKIPAIAVVGKAEMEKGTVAIRRLGSKNQEILALDEWVAKLKEEALPPSRQRS